MILLIRGHIRNTFETKDFYNLIKQIYDMDKNLTIYIHTWTIFANNISWRYINIDTRPVTKELIYDYFDDLNHLIKEILIDDDTTVQLIGNLSGTINNGPAPILGWKYYWYGKYKLIEYLYNNTINHSEMVVNLRFDILNNSNNINEKRILKFIKDNMSTDFTQNIFLYDKEQIGIDNIYIGNILTIYILSCCFYHNLDVILMVNTDTKNQEKIVYRINKCLFN